MSATFESLPISKAYAERLKEWNITEPTRVQEEAIPVLTEGKDAIVQSQTGTGKTLAYVLPLLQRIDPSEKKLQALVLVPTRELGAQIAQVAERLTEGSDVRVQLLIGGAAIGRQIEKLRLHPQIVVGTPGRILELIKVKKLSLHFVRSIVLDEADQILELGGMQEVESVIRSALRDRQLSFFSATIPGGVQQLADRWMKDPVRIQVQPEKKAAETLKHFFVVCEDRERIDTLRRLVRTLEPKAGIVFTNEVDKFGEVLTKLKYAGLEIEGLYSDAGKQERAKVMKDFREGRIPLLLATDVAARGIDIPDVTHVFHFDLPIDADHYVHRSGRTGRMGREGTVVSLCTPRQQFIIEKFTKALNIDIAKRMLFEGKLLAPDQLPERLVRQQGKPKAAGSAPLTRSGITGTAQSSKPTPAKAIPPAKPVRETPRQKAEREAAKKNKGAPKWLKEKREQ